MWSRLGPLRSTLRIRNLMYRRVSLWTYTFRTSMAWTCATRRSSGLTPKKCSSRDTAIFPPSQDRKERSGPNCVGDCRLWRRGSARSCRLSCRGFSATGRRRAQYQRDHDPDSWSQNHEEDGGRLVCGAGANGWDPRNTASSCQVIENDARSVTAWAFGHAGLAEPRRRP